MVRIFPLYLFSVRPIIVYGETLSYVQANKGIGKGNTSPAKQTP